ncbi:MAG: cytochrome c oxidase subunit 3 [Gammaproteobacteria bacterium]|nr:cytochrome c oxidase subunit 3 [Gammaproteobacteria bacterium]
MTNDAAPVKYYLPHGTNWPIIGSIALFTLFWGVSRVLNGSGAGEVAVYAGIALLLYMMFRWFGQVIGESESRLYNEQVDKSFRMGMGWFIFSEVMFFAVFFGALFYARQLSLPWLGGEGTDMWTKLLIWPSFENEWPSNGPGAVGGNFSPMGPFPIPALNTAILLTSGVTLTIAHHALKAGRRGSLLVWLGATFILGFVFMGCQVYEYYEAYTHLNLTLQTGIYGSTFYMLTGFHGAHVTIGAIMLTVIWLRCLRGHFTPDRHFAFEGVAWYWHFVDVVWLGLFIFVYWF